MEEIREKVKELKASWNAIFESFKNSSADWQQQLPHLTPVELNEIMQTVFEIFEKVEAPEGFTVNFNLAKNFALVNFNSAISSAKKIEQAQLANLPLFVNLIIPILNALNSMLIFSAKKEKIDNLSDMNFEVSQSLALIKTAQSELANKLNLVNESINKINETNIVIEKLAKDNETASKAVDGIKNLHSEADTQHNKIKELSDEIENLKNNLVIELGKSEELTNKLNDEANFLREIQEESKKQQDKIEALLPKGASVGLANAFRERVLKLERTKWIWMFIFISSIIGLYYVGQHFIDSLASSNQDILIIFVRRLPIFGPLVWLGWFSAIQYGNTVRVQEDYAFKEATSMAFVGYEDHMEHISTVNIDEARTAMNLLSVKTIEILAREPLRIYKHSDNDASPWNSWVKNFLGRKNGKKSLDEMEKQ